MSKKGGNKTKTTPKPPMENKGPKKMQANLPHVRGDEVHSTSTI